MLINIENLKLHPFAEILVPPMKDDEFETFVKSILKWGIRTPVDILPEKEEEKYLIIDGRHRFIAAQKVGLKKIPATVVDITKDKLEDYILSCAVQRRNLTPEQKTCLAVEWIERISKQEPKSSLVPLACKKFAVRKDSIYLLLKIKKEDEELFKYIKSGILSLKDIKKIEQMRSADIPIIKVNSELKLNTREIDEIYSERFTAIEEKEKELNQEFNRIAEIEIKQKELEKKVKEINKEKAKMKELLSVMYVISKQLAENRQKDNQNSFLITEPATHAEISEALQKISRVEISNFPFCEVNGISLEQKKNILRLEHILTFLVGAIKSPEINELKFLIKNKKVFLTKNIVKKINIFFDEVLILQRLLNEIFTEQVLSKDAPLSEKDKDLTQKKQFFIVQNIDSQERE